jgi:hypothetical protein
LYEHFISPIHVTLDMNFSYYEQYYFLRCDAV